METEEKYNKDREQLRQLIDELTSVVKGNKVTLLHLSKINKEQEALIMSQSDILLKKVIYQTQLMLYFQSPTLHTLFPLLFFKFLYFFLLW